MFITFAELYEGMPTLVCLGKEGNAPIGSDERTAFRALIGLGIEVAPHSLPLHAVYERGAAGDNFGVLALYPNGGHGQIMMQFGDTVELRNHEYVDTHELRPVVLHRYPRR